MTASNEITQNPDAERVERRRRTEEVVGRVREGTDRTIAFPPSSRRTTENERTPIDANERDKKILPYPRSVLRLARARIARASTPLAPAALVPSDEDSIDRLETRRARRVMTRESPPRASRCPRPTAVGRTRGGGRLPTGHDSNRALHAATTRTRRSKPPVSPSDARSMHTKKHHIIV